MENLIIELLPNILPPEVQAALEIGKIFFGGNETSNLQGNPSAAIFNEQTAEKFISPAALGINPATATLTLAVAAGFIFINSKLNKIQGQLQDIRSDLTEIKEIVSDSQEYEVGKLFADFKTYLQESQLLVVENKAKDLSNLRSEFLKIRNRVKFLADMIGDRKKIIILRDTFMQYVKLYHACAECAVRCSMAGEEYQAAKKLISDSSDDLKNFYENYRESFIVASTGEVASIPYNKFAELSQNYFQIKYMRECVTSSAKIIFGLESKKFSYLEFDKKMNDLQKIGEPAMLIIK